MFTGVCLSTGRVHGAGGLHGPGGGACSGGVPGGDPHPTATAAGGTHPTGMHSCWLIKFGCRFAVFLGNIQGFGGIPSCSKLCQEAWTEF